MSRFYGAPRVLADLPYPTPPDPFEYHFFVSYTTREDEVKEILPTIDEFVDELRAAGLRVAPVFFDRFSIGRWHGTDVELARCLHRAIHSSVCMLAFVSPSYVYSDWCRLEWNAMVHCESRYTHTFPVVWKDLGESGWVDATLLLGLRRLPDRLRVIYPDMFIPPSYELGAAASDSFFPVETFEDRMGWERAVREAYSFIVDRTNRLSCSSRLRRWGGNR